MNENADIAFLAASCEREMRTSLAGSSLKYNRTDFRRFLGNGQPVPMQHHQYPQYNPYPAQQNYAPPLPQHPQQYAPVDPYIPEGVIPPSDAKLLPVPQTHQPLMQQNSPSSNIEPVNSFQIPDYNSPKKNYLEDEEQFREALIEEIKSLKNNIKNLKTQINKLTKTVEQLIVPSDQSTQQDIKNDNTDKS